MRRCTSNKFKRRIMERSYKFRLYPTANQETLIQRTFGCCRFVFNLYLAERMNAYRETGNSTTRFQQDKDLTELKRREETIWLKEVDATALQSSLQNLDAAYQTFSAAPRKGRSPVILASKVSTKNGRATKASSLIPTSRFLTTLCSSLNSAKSNAKYRRKPKAVSYQPLSARTTAASISCPSAAQM